MLRSLAELETVRSAWNDWCDDPNADMELYLAWARRHAEFVRPHVVVIFRDDQPECILVGRLENRRLQIKLGYAKLLRPKVRQLFFVRFGFLGNTSAENMELLVRSFKASLDNGEADLAEISRPRPMPQLDSAIASQFRTIRRDHFAAENEHRWLELPGTFDEFIDSLSRKDRHEFRRHEKKLKEQFPAAHIQCYRSEHELDSLTHAMEQISGKTYQRALGTGFVADDETLESLRITARQGGLRGCVLYMNDEPGAFFLARAYKHRLHGNYMGFDPKFSKYSPGLKVLMHAVEDCYDPEYPVRELDLGWGDRRYKRMICNRSCKDGVAHIYAPTAKAISLNFLCSAVRGLDVAARWAVENSRFLQRLKKAWLDRRALRSGESTDEEP
ncbi:MAG TPA: GNAT family N-acetyltransferase [Candidatus Koribacter sp.]